MKKIYCKNCGGLIIKKTNGWVHWYNSERLCDDSVAEPESNIRK